MTNLTATQHERWREDGFLHIPGFLDAETMTSVLDWVDEVANWEHTDDRWMHHLEETPAGPRLSRSENFVPFHDGLKELLTTGRLVDVLGALLGEPAVLYKEKINYKYPGGGGYAAHQDAPAYKFVDKHVTCLIAVDAATVDNGCLFFAPGRHDEGLLALDDRGCIDLDSAGTFEWKPVELAPGDALFFSSYAPHHSPPNTTDAPRRALYLTYNAASEGDLHDAYYQEKRESFARAQQSGDPSSQFISRIGHFQGKTVTS